MDYFKEKVKECINVLKRHIAPDRESNCLTDSEALNELYVILDNDEIVKKLRDDEFGYIGSVLPELERPLCVLDLETTGTDVDRSKIVEICVLKVMPDGSEEIKTLLINPGIPIPVEASNIHGITDEMVKGKPTFVQISKSLHDYIKGCDIVGFNSNKFDVPMLESEFSRCGITWDWKSVNMIDVRNIYVQKEERTLSAAVHFYTGKTHDDAHSAEADVKATLDILTEQLRFYPDLPDNFKDLALYSNYGREIIDLAGKFKKNDAGEFVFTFGKHIDQPVKNHVDFLEWMTTKDFPADTLRIVNAMIAGYKPIKTATPKPFTKK